MNADQGGGEPLVPDAADALRALAQEERGRAEQLAAFLEDVAANGLPAPEECTPWELLRERRLAELATGQRVA
ncbi:hypothetical protein [Kitasatospora sp. KL5]|uniref:hypothetical protein n=1 Tax=Kitasatospora sp. KL5 TaxID=3425125 RepID=UPI003D6F53BC